MWGLGFGVWGSPFGVSGFRGNPKALNAPHPETQIPKPYTTLSNINGLILRSVYGAGSLGLDFARGALALTGFLLLG